ncbi:hypothetical protein IZY60_03980 [Lutibacter sp. B2]|nr:hypothetical protein [Lutibacter sp. B2]
MNVSETMALKKHYGKDKNRVIVIEKFKRQQTINTILTAIIIFLSPLLMISFYFVKFYKLEIQQSVEIIILVLILITPIVTVLLRRCPKCGAFLGKYNIALTHCKKCGIRFK